MDRYSGKGAIDRLGLPGKRSGVGLRDNISSKSVPICSRVGCGARMNPVKSTPVSPSVKAKSARTLFHPSSSGKEPVGSSSRSKTFTRTCRKALKITEKKVPCQQGPDLSETSSIHDEPGKLDEYSPRNGVFTGGSGSKEVKSGESSSRTRSLYRKSGLIIRDDYSGPSSSLSGKTSQVARTKPSGQGLNGHRYNSKPDVPTSKYSLSVSSVSGRKITERGRNMDRGNSTTDKGKKVSHRQIERKTENSSRGITISDTRRTRNSSNNRDASVPYSVSGWGSINSCCRDSNSRHGSNRYDASPVATSGVAQPSLDAPITTTNRDSYREASSWDSQLREIIDGSTSEPGIDHPLIFDRDSYRHYNIDGVAEVLLALERIEQDEELSYEHLLVLESNLFLNGLTFHDQHREMRLDIDDMSYEDLLALEERIGTVSTAVSEDALSKCLKTSIHHPRDMNEYSIGLCGNNDTKCSICQEEYASGDEIGSMLCEHNYHLACIQQWLRMKNWCPICKAAAEASTASDVITTLN